MERACPMMMMIHRRRTMPSALPDIYTKRDGDEGTIFSTYIRALGFQNLVTFGAWRIAAEWTDGRLPHVGDTLYIVIKMH